MDTEVDGETESLVEDLVNSKVIEEDKDGSLKLSNSFMESEQKIRDDIESGGKSETFGLFEGYSVDEIRETIENWNESYDFGLDDIDSFVARTISLHDIHNEWGLERCVQVALALRRFDEAPIDYGTPDGFIPVNYNEIELFLQSNPVSVVYIWGDDCKPCEVVRDDLETLVEEGKIPEGVGLASVYAPEGGEYIRERFDVKYIPTILFCVDGRVDSRLLGKPYPVQIKGEIDVIAETID